MNPEIQNLRHGTLFCVMGAMCWGLSGACSEALFNNYTVETSWVTAVRMLIAGLALVIYTLAKKEVKICDMLREKNSLTEILVFALAGLTLCQFSYLNAIKWTNAGTATVLQNLSIIFIAIYICLSEKHFPQKRVVFCIALALIGVWIISTSGKPGSMVLTPKGLFWGLAAGFGAASYSLLSKKPVIRWGSIPVTGMGMLIGGIVLSITVRVWIVPSDFDIKAIALMTIIVFVGTIGAFTLFLKGISLVGPVKASILACLEPLTATTLSALWLHSSFSFTDIIGFFCIMITVFLIR